MHIAICDDNIADRKHLERLLSRESDKRAGTPRILYVDSFGDKDHFLSSPLLYDMIFLDMAASPNDSREILRHVIEKGFTGPLVLCSSLYDYTAWENLPENVHHIQKPYIPDPLPDLLAFGDAHVQGNIETIPVHVNGEIAYVPKDNIYYFAPNASGNAVYMQDGTTYQVSEDACAFQLLTEPYKEFFRITKRVIINVKFISMQTPITVMMQDYREFYYSPLRYSELKYLKYDIDEMEW